MTTAGAQPAPATSSSRCIGAPLSLTVEEAGATLLTMVEVLVRFALLRWLVLPCVVGTVGYYLVVKTFGVVQWILIGPDRREIERRRRLRRDAVDW